MLTVNISTLKNQLSAILQKVRKGEEVLVVDRNHPVARVSTVGSHVVSQEGALIRDLERRGLILPATKQMKSKKWIALRLVKAKGVSAVEALLQEREESM